MTLVGIIGEVKYAGLERTADNAIYRPFAQQPWPHVFLAARTAGDPAALALTVQREIADVDRAITLSAVTTPDNVVSDAASFAAASGALLLFALVACYVPARRATRIEPALALRAE